MLKTERDRILRTPLILEPPVRIQATRSDLEQILLGYLREAPYCKEAMSVAVERVGTRRNGANWKVHHFEPGRAQYEDCERAMRYIVRLVQQHFDLAPDA